MSRPRKNKDIDLGDYAGTKLVRSGLDGGTLVLDGYVAGRAQKVTYGMNAYELKNIAQGALGILDALAADFTRIAALAREPKS